ncbi:MAG TPA: hypothetical protein VGH15_05795 [Caulobacteraceae bacterium]|jgi:hypothetical protein
MIRPRRSLVLPIATLILAALAVSLCHRPAAVGYARAISEGQRAAAQAIADDAANRDDGHGANP